MLTGLLSDMSSMRITTGMTIWNIVSSVMALKIRLALITVGVLVWLLLADQVPWHRRLQYQRSKLPSQRSQRLQYYAGLRSCESRGLYGVSLHSMCTVVVETNEIIESPQRDDDELVAISFSSGEDLERSKATTTHQQHQNCRRANNS